MLAADDIEHGLVADLLEAEPHHHVDQAARDPIRRDQPFQGFQNGNGFSRDQRGAQGREGQSLQSGGQGSAQGGAQSASEGTQASASHAAGSQSKTSSRKE